MIWLPTGKDGCSADSGSWKIIPTSRPRRRRISASERVRRSVPLSQISPVTLAYFGLCRPRIAEDETDLPEPDSPTIPRVLPDDSAKSRPSTALTIPSAVVKWTFRSLTDSTMSDAGAWRSSVVEVEVNGFPSSADSNSGIDEGVQDVDDDICEDHE